MSKTSTKIDKSLELRPQTAAPDSPSIGEIYNDAISGLMKWSGTSWDAIGADAAVNSDQINMVVNPRGENGTTGWTSGSYTAGVKPTGAFTESSGLGAFDITSESGSLSANGSTRLRFTKSVGANRQGRAIETIMTVPAGYQASVLSLEILYKTTSAAFVAGVPGTTNYSSMIWYCAESTDGITYTMLEPSSFSMVAKGNPDTLRGYVQVGPTANYLKLIAYVSETANSAWEVEADVSVSKTTYAYGTIITDWESYVPTITAVTTNPVMGAGATTRALFRRVGDSMEIKYNFFQTAVGSAGSGRYLWNIPNQGIIDTNKVSISTSNIGAGGTIVGSGYASVTAASGTNTAVSLTVVPYSATQLGLNYFNGAAAQMNPIGSGAYGFGQQPVYISFFVSIPIRGWSAGAQLADGYDGRVVEATVNGTGTSVGSVATKLTGFTITKDKSGQYSVANQRFEITSPGSYVFSGSVGYVSTTTTVTRTVLAIRKNCVTVKEVFGYNTPVNGSSSLTSGTFEPLEAVAGDYFELYFTQESGANKTMASQSFSMFKISGAAFMSPTETIAASYYCSANQASSPT